jgi:hypothetical protein
LETLLDSDADFGELFPVLVVVGDLESLCDMLRDESAMFIFKGQYNHVPPAGLFFLVSTVAGYSHVEIERLGTGGPQPRRVHILQWLEFFFVDQDDSFVLKLQPRIFVVGLFLLPIVALPLPFFAAVAYENLAAVLGVRRVVFVDLGDGDSRVPSWIFYISSSTGQSNLHIFSFTIRGVANTIRIHVYDLPFGLPFERFIGGGEVFGLRNRFLGKADGVEPAGKVIQSYDGFDLRFCTRFPLVCS